MTSLKPLSQVKFGQYTQTTSLYVTQQSHRHSFHGWQSPHQPWLPFFLWSQRHFSLAVFLTCLEPSLLLSAQEAGQHPMGSVTANLPRQFSLMFPSYFIS